MLCAFVQMVIAKRVLFLSLNRVIYYLLTFIFTILKQGLKQKEREAVIGLSKKWHFSNIHN